MTPTNRPSVIIGIHGLANKPPLEEKRKWWKAAIVEGLDRNHGCTPGELAFEFVYWADLRYDEPIDPLEYDEPYYVDEGHGPFPRHEASEDHRLANKAVEAVYKGIDWIETKTGVTPVDDMILEYGFDDLWHYYSETAFAQQVRGRLIERLKRHFDHRILLVAHSMGSIIAYDALRMLERELPSLKVDRLVTLGSPLGLAAARMKIASENGETRIPNNLSNWLNLADPRDLAAVAGDLNVEYEPNDFELQIKDIAVTNNYLRKKGTDRYHNTYGYLRTPEFSEIVRDYIT